MSGAARSMSGKVEHLFLKPARGKPMLEVASFTCIACLGLQGDVHANRFSPRQVLVTLACQLDDLAIAPGALYENMVVSLAQPDQFLPGAALVVDGAVEIRLTMFCEPCKIIEPVVGDLGKMIHRRGILGVVVNGGDIRAGGALKLFPNRYVPLPESAYQRFVDFVVTIPPGRVVRYLDVTTAIGVDASFIRALPGYIKRACALNLPLHRIVNARGGLLNSVPGQASMLADEGVAMNGGFVDLVRYCWQGEWPLP